MNDLKVAAERPRGNSDPESEELIGSVQKNRTAEVRVRNLVYQGRPYLDVRVFEEPRIGAPEAEGHPTGWRGPTSKGVTIVMSRAAELIEICAKALERARLAATKAGAAL